MPVQNALDPAAALKFVQETDAKIDAVMEKLTAIPTDQLTIRTIPAVSVGRGPSGDIPPQATTESPSLPPDVPAATAPSAQFTKPERTEAETFDHIARFLDPAQLGPLFVSKPIRRRVFFGVYPSFAEILSSEKVLGPPPKDTSVEVNNLWIAAGELSVVIKGFLWANDPAIEKVLTNPGDPSKWPALKLFALANNRDPNYGADLWAIWVQYQAWKGTVTPTEAELEKYYAMSG